MKVKVFSVLVLMVWGANAVLLKAPNGLVLVEDDGFIPEPRTFQQIAVSQLGWSVKLVRHFESLREDERREWLQSRPELKGIQSSSSKSGGKGRNIAARPNPADEELAHRLLMLRLPDVPTARPTEEPVQRGGRRVLVKKEAIAYLDHRPG